VTDPSTEIVVGLNPEEAAEIYNNHGKGKGKKRN